MHNKSVVQDRVDPYASPVAPRPKAEARTRSERALQAAADPTRQAILALLRGQEQAVGDIAAQFDASQQAISQHLKVLKDAGLVEARREGTRHLYTVVPEGFTPIAEFLAEFWPGKLDELKTAVEGRDGSESE